MVSAEYTANFVLVVGFPPIQKAAGTQAVAFLFALLCFLSIVFVHFWVPETKGLSLEQMDSLFGDGYKFKGNERHQHHDDQEGLGVELQESQLPGSPRDTDSDTVSDSGSDGKDDLASPASVAGPNGRNHSLGPSLSILASNRRYRRVL
jgi:hypothetical protein